MKKRILLLIISIFIIILFFTCLIFKIKLDNDIKNDIESIKRFNYVDRITVSDFISLSNISLSKSDDFYYYRVSDNMIIFIEVESFTGDINKDIVKDSGITMYKDDILFKEYLSLLLKCNGIKKIDIEDVINNTKNKALDSLSYEVDNGIYIHYHSKYNEYIISRSYKE